VTLPSDNELDVRDLSLEAVNRDDIFEAVAACTRADKRAIMDAFAAREAEGSTAVVEGLALPHAGVDGIDHAMLVDVRLARAVAWAANDDGGDDAVERCFCVVFPRAKPDEAKALFAEAARRVAAGE
jgi:mannitol/fructose-specific phosphotransferase system IIA component (Ntr-type)